MRAAILSVSGTRLTGGESAMLSRLQPWGVILMRRSCESRVQVRALVDEIWMALGRACLVFIDQEGGRVARLKPPEWPVFPSGHDYLRVFERDADAGREAVWLGHRLIAAELAPLGIHADCAPVVDLFVPGTHDAIGDRTFGRDPRTVGTLASAALDGLRAGGVAGVIKHIPGQGRAMADSHLELPRVDAAVEELAQDFAAFARVAHAPMAMTAHIEYSAFGRGVAATVSADLISAVIRERIGFDGLLMSDDLGMKALGGTLASRVQASLSAGCDVALHCSGFSRDGDEILAEMTEVGEAAWPLAGRSLERAKAAEAAATHADTSFDPQAGWERFRELMAGKSGRALA